MSFEATGHKKKGIEMKKIRTILCLILLFVLLPGCGPVSVAGEEPPVPAKTEDNGVKEDPAAGEIEDNNPEEPPLHEWTAEEKALLGIDFDKIIIQVFDYEKWKTDDVGLLLSRFPEAVLISRVYVDKDRFGEDARHEVWRIDPSGLMYFAYFYINGNEINGKRNVPMNAIQRITGRVDGLITGLVAPIETTEMMMLLGIPENAWAEKKWTKSLDISIHDYDYVYRDSYDGGIEDLVSINIPDPNNEWEEIKIFITTSKLGYISPEDEIELYNASSGV